MTSSRLDRLFVLLETGSSSVTRLAAAKQLGEVQKLHPHELNTLLSRTGVYLKSNNWETRIAAAEAVRAIVSNVPQWMPEGVKVEDGVNQTSQTSTIGRLRLEQFDMKAVLSKSSYFMASEGKEYDLEDDSQSQLTNTTEIKEKMAKQRQLLNTRLGLNVLTETELINNEDLVNNSENVLNNERKPLIDLITSTSLSSREMNRAKRKARQAINKQKSDDSLLNQDEPDVKRIKIDDLNDLEMSGDNGDWPLEWFCDQLIQDLFNLNWEIRHGAATALREIITVHGKCGGRATYLSKQLMNEFNQIWLEDLSIRLLCVLALDRFGDFLSDSVVAPVRETCAQALCAIVKLMTFDNCKIILNVLLELLKHNEWETRHGGLLGLKYLLAIREDDLLLKEAFPYILNGLSDEIDDVGAVAASCLIPVTKKLLNLMPDEITNLINKLWDLLSEQDELGSACNSFMGLLASILNLTNIKKYLLIEQLPLEIIVPKLFPFLCHNTSNVRKSTLQTLQTLTECKGNLNENSKWTAQLLQDTMRHIYQRVLIESNSDVRFYAEICWNQLIRNANLTELLHAACPFITIWLYLCMYPARLAIDPNFLIQNNVKQQQKKKLTIQQNDLEQQQHYVMPPKCFIGGIETTPLLIREQNIMEVRCMCARMLGLLSNYIIKPAPGIDYIQLNLDKPLQCYENVLLVHLNSKSALQRMMIGLIVAEWAKQQQEITMELQANGQVENSKEYLNNEQKDLKCDNLEQQNTGKHSNFNQQSLESDVVPEENIGKCTENIEKHSNLQENIEEHLNSEQKDLKCDNLEQQSTEKHSNLQENFEKLSKSTQDVKEHSNFNQQSLESDVLPEGNIEKCTENMENCSKSTENVEKVSNLSQKALNIDNLQSENVELLSNLQETTKNEITEPGSSQKCIVEHSSVQIEPLNLQKPIREDLNEKCPERLKQRLHECLNERVYFDEIATSFTRLTQETRDFMATLKHYKVDLNMLNNTTNDVFTLEKIEEIISDKTKELINKQQKLKQKIQENLEERRKNLQECVQQTSNEQLLLNISTLSAISGAIVMFNILPLCKLTPVIKPLMESIRRENDENLQKITARHLTFLLDLCRHRQPCPNDKILVNLSVFLRSDPEFTPIIHKNMKNLNYNSILTLINQQRNAEKAVLKRSNSTGVTGRGPGRPSNADLTYEEMFNNKDDDEQVKLNRIQRRGATLALIEITKYFGKDLQLKVPKLWDLMIGQLSKITDFQPNDWLDRDCDTEELLWQLQVLEVIIPYLHEYLLNEIIDICLERLCKLLSHPYNAIRHLTSRCLSIFAKLKSVKVMELIVEQVLPKLETIDNDVNRQGAIEVLACIIDQLQFDIIPYIVLLVIPLLGRMSDSNKMVRLMGTNSFAKLIQLMPLDGGVMEPMELHTNQNLINKRNKEREFLQQLLTPNLIPDYKIPVKLTCELRHYQQQGVNWLAFLNKYKLHGILCDDMGLGKTLQSICILASDHYNCMENYKKMKVKPLPSLVICPPTLTGHWVYEVEKFLTNTNKYLKPLQYNGSPVEREKLRIKFKKYNLIVASYDIVRKDIAVFSNIKWNYIILDEGHIIKNGKTRTSIAIKSLISNHRLILSGTPIQNNVLELWSLFDFLMPGFLGTEKEFTARYSRPILNSRDPKCLPKDQEAGVLAMEGLHRQVLPFLLRRIKEDVLNDLPPKITQDYYCELSGLQQELYEDFSKSHIHESLKNQIETSSLSNSPTHIFQALRYLQNVCNHPKLVLNEQHPNYKKILGELKEKNSSLNDIMHSAKLPALRQLLQDCGIGLDDNQQILNSDDLIINQHRALIFCQLKVMLDIIENDLFKKLMPNVTYLRLDGSVPTNQRYNIVTKFNNDPSIDVLLLTTQVGGLGLNLTGADTVIFVEHDWNPMKDLQAMDRAHRIGQRKVVNVYRLITRGTLEEKIMGLQKFKVQTVNTIITGNNSRLETMGTDQLLDLFNHRPSTSSTTNTPSTSRETTTMLSGSMKSILETLPDLWDQKQYDDEYDLSQFISKLN